MGYQKDESVSESASIELGLIGEARAVEPLITALKDDSKEVRIRSAEALGLGFPFFFRIRLRYFWKSRHHFGAYRPAWRPLT
jgi:HEAT repeat protein